MDLYARRKNVNRVALTISVAAAAFGLMWLVLILWTLFYEGFNAIDWRTFSEMTPPPGAEGGLLNAIFGSLDMTVVATVIGTPVGLLAGTYMAEYGKGTALANVVRFINDILLSAPSISSSIAREPGRFVVGLRSRSRRAERISAFTRALISRRSNGFAM